MNIINQYKGLKTEVYILFIGRIVTSLGSMIWPMLTLILSQKMNLSASMISILLVGANVIAMPASLLGGKVADQYNKKHIIVICDAISVMLYIICGLIPLNYVSVVLMVLASVMQQMEYPSYNALIADLTSSENREKAYSLQYLGMNLGLVLAPTISGILFQNYLWLAFLISGISIGISTVLIGLFVKDIEPVKEVSEQTIYQQSQDDQSLWHIIKRNKVILLYIVMYSFYSMAYSQYNYLMPLDMGRIHGENGALIFGTVSSINCLVVVLFTPFITHLFRKFKEVQKVFIGVCLVLSGYIVFLVFLGIIPFYYVAMVLFTWGEIFVTISEGPYFSNRIPASHRGRINGLSSVMVAILIGIGNLMVGQLYDVFSSAMAWVCVLSFNVIAIVLCILILYFDRRQYPSLYK